MLCQQCHTNAATVHFSIVSWSAEEETRHLCEACFPKAEEEHVASYSSKKPFPAIDVEAITALEYLEFFAKGSANSADKPIYRHLRSELERFPATRSRLAIEMLTLARNTLGTEGEGWSSVLLGIGFGDALPAEQTSAFVELLEGILLRATELMLQSPNPPSHMPLGIVLRLAGDALRGRDPARLSRFLNEMRLRHAKSSQGRAVIEYLEQQVEGDGPCRE